MWDDGDHLDVDLGYVIPQADGTYTIFSPHDDPLDRVEGLDVALDMLIAVWHTMYGGSDE